MSVAAAALAVSGLERRFGGIRAVDGVSFAIAAGERRAVIGPNGAGKTTLFNVLTGELAPTAGTVHLHGADVTGMRTWQLARRGLARMYQRNELFAALPARDNVALALAAAKGPYRASAAGAAEERREAMDLLGRVGLSGREAVAPRALSHGERRQLELAVTLAQRPSVLLLDEPTAGMSPAETAAITRLIGELDRSLTILVVEHDMDVVFRVADRITVLHEGKVIADGSPDEVRGDRVVHDVYLGKALEA
ncbi:MAG TPA: ABC transporter ATP-binding protein [Candidatus Limnocylindria bacterium]